MVDSRKMAIHGHGENCEAFNVKWGYRILQPLLRENSDISTRRTITPSYLANYRDIKFILNPKITTNEKIIEGWVLSEIGRNQVLDKAIGSFTCFGNNVPIGYLKFADIIGYQDLGEGLRKYKVIEVKKDESTISW